MIPAGLQAAGDSFSVQLWVLAGFSVFLVVEQFLH